MYKSSIGGIRCTRLLAGATPLFEEVDGGDLWTRGHQIERTVHGTKGLKDHTVVATRTIVAARLRHVLGRKEAAAVQTRRVTCKPRAED